MKIGFDGKRAANNLTGLGNYSRSLIAQLAEAFPQNQYFVYTPKIKEHLQILSFFKQKQVFLKLPEQGSLKLMWRTMGVKKQIKKDAIDLFHGLSHEIPVGLKKEDIKSLVTIHDLIYLRYPQYYKPIDRYIYDLKGKYACKNSDRIIAISECTKRDLISLYQVDEKKIDVVYQSCDDSFKQPRTQVHNETVRKKYKLPEKYLLNVGTIEPRKNLLQIIRALKDIPADYKLVAVGKHQPYIKEVWQEIETLRLNDRVIFLQGLPFADLPSVYQMAALFLYPSFYEGFGIPIIEALYSGIPVIAATGSCLEEAGGPDSMYVHPQDPASLAAAANKILTNPLLGQQMREKGLNYVQKFENHLLAKTMMDCYLKTLNGNFAPC